MADVLEFPAQAEAIKGQALTWPETARALRIVDAETYRQAGELLLGIKALRKRVADVHDPNIKRWLDGHRASLKDKADAEAPLTEAERIVKDGMLAWDREQERQRREAQRLADEEVRRREEDERVARAAAMEREGHDFGDETLVQEAHALINEPAPVVTAAPIAKATPTVKGISYRTTYSAQVTDLVALIRFVAANPSHAALLSPNMTALNAQARSLKQALRLPGVHVIETRDVAAGVGR
jgi:hypothetical protein